MNKFSEAIADDFDAFLRLTIEQPQTALMPDTPATEWAYRGQASAAYGLVPSLFRQVAQAAGSTVPQLRPRQIIEAETILLYEFYARLGDEHDPTGWDTLFRLQHYGVPSRALDWTWAPLIALWFALEDHDQPAAVSTDPVVWRLNAGLLNMQEWITHFPGCIDPVYLSKASASSGYRNILGMDGRFGFNAVAVISLGSNQRLRTQQGLFTIFGDHYDALETLCPQALTRISIGATCAAQARRIFAAAGMDVSTMYPDIQGFARRSKQIIHAALT